MSTVLCAEEDLRRFFLPLAPPSPGVDVEERLPKRKSSLSAPACACCCALRLLLVLVEVDEDFCSLADGVRRAADAESIRPPPPPRGKDSSMFLVLVDFLEPITD